MTGGGGGAGVASIWLAGVPLRRCVLDSLLLSWGPPMRLVERGVPGWASWCGVRLNRRGGKFSDCWPMAADAWV